ncbi:mitochondrial inner membrane protein required for protein import [Tulasnella sp. 403]|nr:mitochondrial inner membrane protein required for protein import [Tulasnella sp. 403]
MTDRVTLSTITVDILAEIVKHDLDAHDLLSLRLSCRSLYHFISQKLPWILYLKRLSALRPLPIPPFRKLSSLALPELTSIAIKANNLMHNWTSPAPEARPAFKMVTFSPNDVIVSILLIPHTPYVLTLSAISGPMRTVSWITCVDTERGKKIARYRSEGLVSSWRAEAFSEGAVIIALLVGPEDRSTISPELPATHNVLRLCLPDPKTYTPAAFIGISSHLITSPITGMFLTPEVAGLVSVIRETQTSGLLMTRFRDRTTAYIDSGVPAQLKPNLNTIANQTDLILYTEDNVGASAYAYSFAEDLFPLFAPSPPHSQQRLIRLPPSTIQSFKFHPSELCEGSNNAYTIIRTKWPDFVPKAPVNGQTHSEISVLSMAFVLGADPSGIHDHRCISHMYLDPFRPIDSMEEGDEDPVQTQSTHGSSSSELDTPDITMHPSFDPSAPHSPSPTLAGSSILGDDELSKTSPAESAPIVRRTFHSCLEEKKEIWQGPSHNDLISVGLGASHAIWLAAGEQQPELKLASFEEPPYPLPLRTSLSPCGAPLNDLAPGTTPGGKPLASSSGSGSTDAQQSTPTAPDRTLLPSLDFEPASESSGQSERTGARSAGQSLSSIERKRRFMTRTMLGAMLFGAVGGWVYMGREWGEGEEKLKKDSIVSGLEDGRVGRANARIGQLFNYFTDPLSTEILPKPQHKPYTLLLSLDDLLITSTWDRQNGWRTAKRPGADYFVAYLSQFFEIVVFTSQHSYTAGPVIEQLDPYGQFIVYRLFREYTRSMRGKVVKDLSYLNRDLSKVILIDTHPEHASAQPENAIILPKWTGDPQDKGLVGLIPFLESIGIIHPPDVRPVLKAYEGKDIAKAYALVEADHKRRFQWLKENEPELQKLIEQEKAQMQDMRGTLLGALTGNFKPPETTTTPDPSSPPPSGVAVPVPSTNSPSAK